MPNVTSPSKVAAILTVHWSPRVVGEVDDALVPDLVVGFIGQADVDWDST